MKNIVLVFFFGGLLFLFFILWKNYFRPIYLYEKFVSSEKRIRKINAFNSSESLDSAIVFLGTSLTEGFDVAVFNHPKVLNRGIGGEFTKSILLRLNEVVLRNPQKIFVEIGINDILANVETKEIESNYLSLILSLKKNTRAKIYVQNILPVSFENGVFVNDDKTNEKAISFNQFLKRLCIEHSLTYIDLYSSFEVNLRLNQNYTYDGVHLNKKGYEMWRKCVEKQIEE